MKEYLTDLSQLDQFVRQFVFPFAWKALGAFALWIAGGLLIRLLIKILVVALENRRIDPTLVNYARQTARFTLRALLILTVLGIFGVETTAFSAILAAAGVAIGVAWSGLLSNFAAGIFLIIFRPFRANESITAAGITGTVREIGLFATTIDNADNLRVFVGNNKIFSDNILNYSINPYRVAVFKVQLAASTEPAEAIEYLLSQLATLSDLSNEAKPSGEITEFNPLGTLITLRLCCHHRNYSSVLATGNQVIYLALKKAKYQEPQNRITVSQSV